MKLIISILLLGILAQAALSDTRVKRDCCCDNYNDCDSSCSTPCNKYRRTNNCNNRPCNNGRNCQQHNTPCDNNDIDDDSNPYVPIPIPVPQNQPNSIQVPQGVTTVNNTNINNNTLELSLINTVNTVNNISIPIYVNSTNENTITVVLTPAKEEYVAGEPIVNNLNCCNITIRNCDRNNRNCSFETRWECSKICTGLPVEPELPFTPYPETTTPQYPTAPPQYPTAPPQYPPAPPQCPPALPQYPPAPPQCPPAPPQYPPAPPQYPTAPPQYPITPPQYPPAPLQYPPTGCRSFYYPILLPRPSPTCPQQGCYPSCNPYYWMRYSICNGRLAFSSQNVIPSRNSVPLTNCQIVQLQQQQIQQRQLQQVFTARQTSQYFPPSQAQNLEISTPNCNSQITNCQISQQQPQQQLLAARQIPQYVQPSQAQNLRLQQQLVKVPSYPTLGCNSQMTSCQMSQQQQLLAAQQVPQYIQRSQDQFQTQPHQQFVQAPESASTLPQQYDISQVLPHYVDPQNIDPQIQTQNTYYPYQIGQNGQDLNSNNNQYVRMKRASFPQENKDNELKKNSEQQYLDQYSNNI